MNAAITAIGGFVPASTLTNKDISEMVDTSEEWIEKRTGIKRKKGCP